MTLQVVISLPQSQSFSADVNVVDQFGENPPVIAQTQHLEPGQCFNTYLTSSRKIEIVEKPLGG